MQYLYGNNQTIAMDTAGNMTLYQFDENGEILS